MREKAGKFRAWRTAASLFLAVAVLAAVDPAAAPAQNVLPPARWMAENNYDQQHIKLDLRFDWERQQASGTAEITLKPLEEGLRRVRFDAANMTVSEVKLASGVPLKFEVAKDDMVVDLDRAYRPGEEITVVISYHTNGASNELTVFGMFRRGLNWVEPTPYDPRRPRQVWSQGEGENNHFWFPCFDQPNDFVTTELIATVDEPLRVISNGILIETKKNLDGTRTFHWKTDVPHAVYLTSIIAGEFVPLESIYDGIPVMSYVRPDQVEEGRVTGKRLAEMVKFFSEETGLRYPYEKYAQTFARDYTGGVEFISATTLSEQYLQNARATLDETQDSIISHELVHQWFGDYVTCRTWAHMWLNESFASYYDGLWAEHSLGHDEFLYREVKSNQDLYFAAWNRGLRRPVVTWNYSGLDSLIDVYSYERGAAVLHMLRKMIGEDAWRRAVIHYLRKHAHRPVSTEEFRIAFEETTGMPLDWFLDQWIYKMGHPVFRVAQGYDPQTKVLTLNVRQEQQIDLNNPYPQAELFRAPLEVEIETAGGTRVERVMIEPVREQELTFPVDSKPLLVNFDYESTLVKELSFDKPVEDLAYQLSRDKDLTGRLWALGELLRLAKEPNVTEVERGRTVAAMASALAGDKFWGVRAEAAEALGAVQGETARAALVAATKDQNSQVRAQAVTVLGARRDPALAAVFRSLLKDRSYSVIKAAGLALGRTKSRGAYEALTDLLKEPSWRGQIQASALEGLAALGDPRTLDAGLRYGAAGNPPAVRAAAMELLAAVGAGDSRVFLCVSEAFLQSIETNAYDVASRAAGALAESGDPRAVAVLEEGNRLAIRPQVQGPIRTALKRLQDKK